jgi:hypothetical protein
MRNAFSPWISRMLGDVLLPVKSMMPMPTFWKSASLAIGSIALSNASV